MQIHHLEVRHSHERVLDPVNGKIVLKRHQYLGAGTAAAITYDDEEYRVQPDGTFEVPDEVGAYYLKRDGWFTGSNPFADELQAHSDRDAEEKRVEAERIAAEEADRRKAEEAQAKKDEADKKKAETK